MHIYPTYEHLSFTLCDDATVFIPDFHYCVHHGSPEGHRGHRAAKAIQCSMIKKI